jgi:hypothetical protein
MLFPILRQSFINRPTLHGLHFQREKLENEVFLKKTLENILKSEIINSRWGIFNLNLESKKKLRFLVLA